MTRTNPLGQPIGEPLPRWSPPPAPPRAPLAGRYCRLEPLEARHADDLHAAYSADTEGRGWTYMAYGPFADARAFREWVEAAAARDDPLFHAVVAPESGRATGVASYMRIDPPNGVIEIGHIHFSPLLKRTPAATEALYLMMQRAFALGYRRCEWKCDALNAPSRAAAQRLGFTYEGLFRNAVIYKGRNRDSAWYSIIDAEWPALEAAFLRWLAPSNFDGSGRQRARLSDLTAAARAASG